MAPTVVHSIVLAALLWLVHVGSLEVHAQDKSVPLELARPVDGRNSGSHFAMFPGLTATMVSKGKKNFSRDGSSLTRIKLQITEYDDSRDHALVLGVGSLAVSALGYSQSILIIVLSALCYCVAPRSSNHELKRSGTANQKNLLQDVWLGLMSLGTALIGASISTASHSAKLDDIYTSDLYFTHGCLACFLSLSYVNLVGATQAKSPVKFVILLLVSAASVAFAMNALVLNPEESANYILNHLYSAPQNSFNVRTDLKEIFPTLALESFVCTGASIVLLLENFDTAAATGIGSICFMQYIVAGLMLLREMQPSGEAQPHIVVRMCFAFTVAVTLMLSTLLPRFLDLGSAKRVTFREEVDVCEFLTMPPDMEAEQESSAEIIVDDLHSLCNNSKSMMRFPDASGPGNKSCEDVGIYVCLPNTGTGIAEQRDSLDLLVFYPKLSEAAPLD